MKIIGTEKPLWFKYPEPPISLKRKQFELSKRRGRSAENRFLSSGTFNGHKINRERIGRDFDVIQMYDIFSPIGSSKIKRIDRTEVKHNNAILSELQKRMKQLYGSRYNVIRI